MWTRKISKILFLCHASFLTKPLEGAFSQYQGDGCRREEGEQEDAQGDRKELRAPAVHREPPAQAEAR